MSIVSGEETNRPIVISDEQIPFGAYQAIYHKLTGKVEKIIRRFDEPHLIHKEDVRQLHLRLTQLIKPWAPQGTRCEISHSLKEGHGAVYSSLEKFEISDKSTTATTTSLTYEFDFLLVLPSEVKDAQDVAQRYKVSVHMRQILEGSENLPYFLRPDKTAFIGVRIEYADYAVAQSLEACVTGWVSTLKKIDKSALSKFILSSEAFCEMHLDSAVRSAALFGGAAFVAWNMDTISATRAASISLFCLGLGFLSYTIVSSLTTKFFGVFHKFAPKTTLLFTRGDENANNELKSTLAKGKSVMSFIVATIIISFIVNFASAYLYDMIVPK